jgi:hypothetical protein
MTASKHSGMQCSYYVSMSGLHNGQDFCHIGREMLTLALCFRIFPYPLPIQRPKYGGRWLNFRMGFFEPDVRMNGASFAPNLMFIRRTVWPQLTIRTHTHMDTHTHTLDDSNSRSFHRNDLADHFIEMIC